MGVSFSQSPPKTKKKQIKFNPEWCEENRLLLKQLVIDYLDQLNADNQITLCINTYIYREGHTVVSYEKILETLKEVIHQPFTYHTMDMGGRFYLIICLIIN